MIVKELGFSIRSVKRMQQNKDIFSDVDQFLNLYSFNGDTGMRKHVYAAPNKIPQTKN